MSWPGSSMRSGHGSPSDRAGIRGSSSWARARETRRRWRGSSSLRRKVRPLPPRATFAMRVIRLTLAYDGTDFRGWARQHHPEVRTVEGSLTDVLTRVLREDIELSVAGRTDAGVHARGQVASFMTPSRLAPERI